MGDMNAKETHSIHVTHNWIVAVMAFTPFIVGCTALPLLPPANLTEPGWTIYQGQALWRTKNDAPEIAGEFLVGLRENGQTFAQFTKNPLPMIIAQASTNHWQVEMPMQNKRYAGKGKPPKRLIWLYLPSVLAGQPPPAGWSWQQQSGDAWRLENTASGERLEIYRELTEF